MGPYGVRFRRHGDPRWKVTGDGFDLGVARRRQLDEFLRRVRTRDEIPGVPRAVQALEWIERAYAAEREDAGSWRFFAETGVPTP